MGAWGIPYMGSKNKICDWVVGQLPKADVLVDLFAGGFAVSHYAIVSGKFKRVIANDISDTPVLFKDAVSGKYWNENRWISRAEFQMFKDNDPFIRYIWSFGNRGDTYLYGADIEPLKRTFHKIVFAESPHERRLAMRAIPECLIEAGFDLRTPDKLAALGICDHLQRIERLQSLENPALEAIEVSMKDYRDVVIPDGAVVYCDPPYAGTSKYNLEEFDSNAFYDWVRTRSFPVYISEYAMPDDFVVISEQEHLSMFSSAGNKLITERLFVHEKWAERAKCNEQPLLFHE